MEQELSAGKPESPDLFFSLMGDRSSGVSSWRSPLLQLFFVHRDEEKQEQRRKYFKHILHFGRGLYLLYEFMFGQSIFISEFHGILFLGCRGKAFFVLRTDDWFY